VSATVSKAHGHDHPVDAPGHNDGPVRPTWILPPNSLQSLTDQVSEITEKPVPKWWWAAFIMSSSWLLIGVGMAAYLISTGVGVWGEQVPVCWAFDITNFVFWIGIGHAGTLISAILFLFRQKWRTSINRFSEAMTLFAVICAGVYPGIHVGRFWYAWFLAPLPNANHIWPNFKSPLLWDAFAVSTYFTVSLLFWYVGLIPDLATLRDRAKPGSWRQFIFGLMCFGWRGSHRAFQGYEIAYLTLAGISTPLVLSVHSIVSFDFATSVLPGWHTTIFPPYFVAGAIFGGFAMVLTCMIPARYMYGLENIVTVKHVDVMCKIILATGTLVGYAYIMEFFIAYYSGNAAEQTTFIRRMFKEYWWAYWTMMFCNLIAPQIFWFKWARESMTVAFIVSIIVNIGMWFERYVIIITGLYQNPWGITSAQGLFYPTWVDWLQMFGDFGLFFTLTLLFMRFLPMFAMSEIKPLVPEGKTTYHPHDPAPNGHAAPAVAHVSPITVPTPAPSPALEGASKYPTLYGALASFAGPNELLKAVEQLRDAGYTKTDTHTPFPVHGMNKAMGLKSSIMPWISVLGGFTGLSIAVTLTLYVPFFDYPIVVGGKAYSFPDGGWQPYVPIMFELMVLFTAFFTVIGMLVLAGLPRYNHPLFRSPSFQTFSTAGFLLSVEAADPKFDPHGTTALLSSLGGTSVELVEA
jgi:molybdopterin-containing oxidoreductase family membrane subunit